MKPPVAHSFYRRFLFYWLPPVLYCTAIFIQSANPSPFQGVHLFHHADKVMHAAGYSLLAFLWARAIGRTWPRAKIPVLVGAAVVLTVLFGLSDEIHQAFVPSRTADSLDLLADLTGSLIGAAAFVLTFKFRGNRVPDRGEP